MTEIFRRHSLLFTTLCLIVISCQLMSASIQNSRIARIGADGMSALIGPVEVLHHEATHSVTRFWEHYLYLQNVEERSRELASRLEELEAQNSRLIEFQHENSRLRELLNYQAATQRVGVSASVVGRDPSNWSRTVTINRGTKSGVRVGLAVVDGNAVVGQVVAAGPDTASVLLISDPTSAVDAIVQNSRAQGIAEGGSDNVLRLRYVLKEYAVSPGDRVIASGFDGIYPKGTLLGIVTRVDPSANGLFQNVELQPSVDPNRLETVLALLSEGDGQPSSVNPSELSPSAKEVNTSPSKPAEAVASPTPHSDSKPDTTAKKANGAPVKERR